MKSLLIWIVTALVFTAAGGGVVYIWTHAAEREEGEPGEQASESQPSTEGASTQPVHEQRLTHDAAGNAILRLDEESQARLGIEFAPLAAAVNRPEMIAYGALQEDPARSFTVRAPLAGTVAMPTGAQWPALGETLADGTVVGVLEPRLGPVERADLSARLAGARADVQQAKAALEAMQAAIASKRRLHDEGKIVSDQALLEAEAQLKGEEAKLKGTLDTVHILESFMSSATTRPTDTLPLTVQLGGKVVETLVRPGESVESGQAILRVAQYDRLLARVTLPAGELLSADVTHARIAISGQAGEPLPAERVGVAPQADSVTGGQTLLFTLQTGAAALQPGMPIVAHLDLPGEPRQGVVVPRSAIIRFAGRTWVYVRIDPEQLTRRLAPTDIATPTGWFVAEGLQAGDPVVVSGAQSVLAEELSFSTAEEEE